LQAARPAQAIPAQVCSGTVELARSGVGSEKKAACDYFVFDRSPGPAGMCRDTLAELSLVRVFGRKRDALAAADQILAASLAAAKSNPRFVQVDWFAVGENSEFSWQIPESEVGTASVQHLTSDWRVRIVVTRVTPNKAD
jgi:hypothetical protein